MGRPVLLTGCVAVATWHALPTLRAYGGHPPTGVVDRLDDSARVALTFDDGPHLVGTPRLLRLLAEHDVRATFFVVGRDVRRHPDIAAEIVAAGHELASHGFAHRNHLLRPHKEIREDLRRANDAIATVTGSAPRYFRAPQGCLTSASMRAARSLDLQMVHWTTWGRDWSARATASSIERTIMRRMVPGSIALLHDSDAYSTPNCFDHMLTALPRIIDAARAMGLTPGGLTPVAAPAERAFPPAMVVEVAR